MKKARKAKSKSALHSGQVKLGYYRLPKEPRQQAREQQAAYLRQIRQKDNEERAKLGLPARTHKQAMTEAGWYFPPKNSKQAKQQLAAFGRQIDNNMLWAKVLSEGSTDQKTKDFIFDEYVAPLYGRIRNICKFLPGLPAPPVLAGPSSWKDFEVLRKWNKDLIQKAVWQKKYAHNLGKLAAEHLAKQGRLLVEETKRLKSALAKAPKPSPPEGEWSGHMTKAAMSTALHLSRRKFETFTKTYPIRNAGNRQTWQIRLDGMDARTRAAIEKAE